MKRDARVYIAGGETMAGTAIAEHLREAGYTSILGDDENSLALENPYMLEMFFKDYRPEYVFVAAGKTGSIQANQDRPAELMMSNLLVGTTIIPYAHRYGVKKLLYLASSCVYPRICEQPMVERDLMTGPLEPTNEAYAMAKLAGLTLCQAFRRQYDAPFIVGIPTNCFGPGDKFDAARSHVIGGLIRRMDEAKHARARSIQIWGTGRPRREFLSVDDLASACVFAMKHYDDIEPINLGSGLSISIEELAYAIKDVTGFKGTIEFDTTKPDGMPEKVLDSSKLNALGWAPSRSFIDALKETYAWYLDKVVPALARVG